MPVFMARQTPLGFLHRRHHRTALRRVVRQAGPCAQLFLSSIFCSSLEHRIDYAHLPGEIGRNVEGRILKLLEESIDGGANFGIVRELCVAAPGNE
jgi:hypothetical protein